MILTIFKGYKKNYCNVLQTLVSNPNTTSFQCLFFSYFNNVETSSFVVMISELFKGYKNVS